MIIFLLPLFVFSFVGPPPRGGEEAPKPHREPARGKVADFRLTERDGRMITLADLDGKVWVASFVLTRCPDGRCPQVASTVKDLQKELSGRPDLLFVTFTVDPRDDPAELDRYAKSFEADPKRWLFLTGSEENIDAVMRSMYLPGGKTEQGSPVHAQKLVLVDQKGVVRGWYDGLNETFAPEGHFKKNLRNLKRHIDEVRAESWPAWMPRDFPLFNAFLNAIAATLIFTGWLAIRARLTRLHIGCMVAALLVSAFFLASYLYYHIIIKQGVATRFRDQVPDAPEWLAWLYFAILLSHTILAIVATPMALIAAYLGLRRWWPSHVRLARWAMPIWLYVSVTGVVVYWMLYRLGT